ncbi:hypothetical protein RR48_06487 [Papilio machaon]|uniref:Uncharacterized protein n=1 Tax=Papilio machaon TaxID=76193 RepID=A0A194RQ60_PAPMA|nr:hypothetical protein RR48_06487 [Papilio machaon]
MDAFNKIKYNCHSKTNNSRARGKADQKFSDLNKSISDRTALLYGLWGNKDNDRDDDDDRRDPLGYNSKTSYYEKMKYQGSRDREEKRQIDRSDIGRQVKRWEDDLPKGWRRLARDREVWKNLGEAYVEGQPDKETGS